MQSVSIESGGRVAVEIPAEDSSRRNAGHAGEATLELRLLGDFRLRNGPLTVGLTPRAEHLLAFLALHNALRRTAVSAQLWPDPDDAQARGCLRTTLWRLPRPGGLPMVATSADRIYLTDFVEADTSRLVDRLGQWCPGGPPHWILAYSDGTSCPTGTTTGLASIARQCLGSRRSYGDRPGPAHCHRAARPAPGPVRRRGIGPAREPNPRGRLG